jgi:tetratricopeptide (TPR) repeat protein
VDIALFVYCALGCAYWSLGDYVKAIEYHKEHLTMAKEVGDRAGECRAYRNLGISYRSQGDFSKDIEHHAQRLAIAKEVGGRAGEGRAYGSPGCAYRSQGDFSKASNTTRSAWRLQRRWATGRGRAGRTGTSELATST